jgi:hypothetical protein
MNVGVTSVGNICGCIFCRRDGERTERGLPNIGQYPGQCPVRTYRELGLRTLLEFARTLAVYSEKGLGSINSLPNLTVLY